MATINYGPFSLFLPVLSIELQFISFFLAKRYININIIFQVSKQKQKQKIHGFYQTLNSNTAHKYRQQKKNGSSKRKKKFFFLHTPYNSFIHIYIPTATEAATKIVRIKMK